MELRRLCVFCGSSVGGSPIYAAGAAALGRALVEANVALVYGGGSIGLMGVLADTMLAAGGDVIGVIPQSLVDLEVEHRGLSDLRVVGSMHERKALMDGGVERRGFQLVGYPTRGLRAGELHELVVTDQPGLGTDARVDRVAYQGFVEITQAGVAVRGDRLVIGGREVGVLAGFDECHMPNHLTIVVYSPDWRGGRARGLALGDVVSFEPPGPR